MNGYGAFCFTERSITQSYIAYKTLLSCGLQRPAVHFSNDGKHERSDLLWVGKYSKEFAHIAGKRMLVIVISFVLRSATTITIAKL